MKGLPPSQLLLQVNHSVKGKLTDVDERFCSVEVTQMSARASQHGAAAISWFCVIGLAYHMTCSSLLLLW